MATTTNIRLTNFVQNAEYQPRWSSYVPHLSTLYNTPVYFSQNEPCKLLEFANNLPYINRTSTIANNSCIPPIANSRRSQRTSSQQSCISCYDNKRPQMALQCQQHHVTHIGAITSQLAVVMACLSIVARIAEVKAGVFYPRGGSFGVRMDQQRKEKWRSRLWISFNLWPSYSSIVSIWQLWPYQWTFPTVIFTWPLILSLIMVCHQTTPTMNGLTE